MRPKTSDNTQEAERIALLYMAYLASDDDGMGRFFSLTGLGADELKSRLLEPAFQAFLLDHLLQDESELLAFSAEQGLKPESILIARSKLPGFSYDA